jgi:hypothetical protein
MIYFYMLNEICFGGGFCLTFIPLTLKVEIDWDMEWFFRVWGDVIEEMIIEFEERGKGDIAVIPMTMVCVIIILRAARQIKCSKCEGVERCRYIRMAQDRRTGCLVAVSVILNKGMYVRRIGAVQIGAVCVCTAFVTGEGAPGDSARLVVETRRAKVVHQHLLAVLVRARHLGLFAAAWIDRIGHSVVGRRTAGEHLLRWSAGGRVLQHRGRCRGLHRLHRLHRGRTTKRARRARRALGRRRWICAVKDSESGTVEVMQAE